MRSATGESSRASLTDLPLPDPQPNVEVIRRIYAGSGETTCSAARRPSGRG